MTTDKNVILLPYWAEDVIKRQKLTMGDLLDFEKVRTIFSVHQLAELLAMQRCCEKIVGSYEGGFFTGLFWQWTQSARGEGHTFLTEVVVPISDHANTQSAFEQEYFNKEARQERHAEPFIIYDLQREVVGLVVYPGWFDQAETNPELQLKLVRALIRAFYAYQPRHEVAQRPLYLNYIRLLAPKQIVVARA